MDIYYVYYKNVYHYNATIFKSLIACSKYIIFSLSFEVLVFILFPSFISLSSKLTKLNYSIKKQNGLTA